MTFEIQRRIRFADVDPAGIVFYPRYFEMINETVEDWFDEHLDSNFHQLTLVRKHGVPLAHVEVDFVSPSKLYERITIALSVDSVGTSSVALQVQASHEGERRFIANLILVHINIETHRSVPWPDQLRTRMLE